MTHETPEHRRAEVERLFVDPANYYNICESITEDRSITTLFVMVFGDRTWTINVADEAVQGVARHLNEYTGPIESSSFIDWAKPLAKAAAIRLSQFYSVIDKHKRDIRAGIRSVLPRNYFDDNNALVEEISQEVYLLVMQHLDSLTEPSSAKLSVRLYGLSRRHALDYHVKKARRRHKAVQRRLSQGGSIDCPEVLSDQELASMAAEQQQTIDC